MISFWLVSEAQGFIVSSLKTKLEGQGMKATVLRADTNSISQEKERPSGIFIYVDEELLKKQSALVYLRDIAADKDVPVFIAGDGDDALKMEALIPDGLLKKKFQHPISVPDVVSDLQEYFVTHTSDGKKHILVVDDSGAMLRNVKAWLEDRYQIALANSGTMAIKYLANNKPDLILLDYEMPVIDGSQVLEMIRSEMDFSNIPVIFLTSKDDKESILKVMALKPNGYLLKTMPPAKIIEAVDDFFAKQRKI